MNSWGSRIAAGIHADTAAGHTVIPGVVRERYPIQPPTGAPTYDVEIGARGGRQHTLLGLTGSVYCQVDQPVWVAIPYGDPHRGAYVLGRQQPGTPRRYGVLGHSAEIKYLGHPQTYRVELQAIVTWTPAGRQWVEPVTDVRVWLDVTVDGETLRDELTPTTLHLRGTRRPDVEYLIVPDTTTLTTTGAGNPSHSHEVVTHDHPAAQEVELPDGFDGPFVATLEYRDVVGVSDYAVTAPGEGSEQRVPPYTTPTSTVDAIVTATVTGDSCTVEIARLGLIELGVYTG